MPAGKELGKIIWNKVQESSKIYFCIIFDCYCQNLIFGGTAIQSLHQALRRIRNFHLISWCRNFVGGHSFRGVSSNLVSWCVNFVGGGGVDTISLEFRVKRLKLCRNCAFSKKILHQGIRWSFHIWCSSVFIFSLLFLIFTSLKSFGSS